MTDTLTLTAGTDAEDNSSITAVMTDEMGNKVDTVVFSATDPKSIYSSYTLKTEEGSDGTTRDSCYVTRFGKLAILKGIAINNFQFGIATRDADGNLKYNTSTNGFLSTGYILPEEYRPKVNEFFYRSVPWHDGTVKDSATYWISIFIHASTGEIYARLERNIDASSTGHGSRNDVSFSLPYFVK